jgi:hypothetical protein
MAAATSCADIEALYGESLAAEALCDPGGARQCRVTVRLSLACGCTTTVNDATESNAIATAWANHGCSRGTHVCTDGCVFEGSLDPCVADAHGVGHCVARGP